MRRTLLIQRTPDDYPPQDLYEIIENESTVVLVTEAPDEGFAVYADHVVEWNEPDLKIDGRQLSWPADADAVRKLFQSGRQDE
jgi:hypothetical protein